MGSLAPYKDFVLTKKAGEAAAAVAMPKDSLATSQKLSAGKTRSGYKHAALRNGVNAHSKKG
jgi:hypothetical protein